MSLTERTAHLLLLVEKVIRMLGSLRLTYKTNSLELVLEAGNYHKGNYLTRKIDV